MSAPREEEWRRYERHVEEKLRKANAEVERLRGLMRKSHPHCPDNPCPAEFPYCENVDAYERGWAEAIEAARLISALKPKT